MTKSKVFGSPRFILVYNICFAILLTVIYLIGKMNVDAGAFMAIGIILAHIVYLVYILKHPAHPTTADHALLQVVIVYILLGLGYNSRPDDDSLRGVIMLIAVAQLHFLISALETKKKVQKQEGRGRLDV